MGVACLVMMGEVGMTTAWVGDWIQAAGLSGRWLDHWQKWPGRWLVQGRSARGNCQKQVVVCSWQSEIDVPRQLGRNRGSTESSGWILNGLLAPGGDLAIRQVGPLSRTWRWSKTRAGSIHAEMLKLPEHISLVFCHRERWSKPGTWPACRGQSWSAGIWVLS